jgi:Uma2 family endonuclease
MSAAPRHPVEGFAGLRMSAQEFFGLGETAEHYELVDGVVVMSPSPTFRHQKLVRLILSQMESLAARTPGLEIALDTDIEFDQRLVYRPNLAVYKPGRLTGTPERLTLCPDLVVEVLSPGSRPMDLTTKRTDYERFGVGEYWVVDPAGGAVLCWRREGGKFVEARIVGDWLESGVIAGLKIDLRPIRGLAKG